MSALTPEALAAMQARAQAATAGPWWQGPHYRCDVESPRGRIVGCPLYTQQAEKDAAFIVACRTDVPALLAHVEAQQAEIERLRAALANFAPGSHDGLWGRIKAFIVNGAPTRTGGIAIARQITEWQVAIDDATVAQVLAPTDAGRVRTTDIECDCGTEDPKSSRHGHNHMPWCAAFKRSR